MAKRTSEAAFEATIEATLLADGYESLPSTVFDRARAILPETVLAFIRETQPTAWGKQEALRGVDTGNRVLAALCKWMDTHGVLAPIVMASSASARRWSRFSSPAWTSTRGCSPNT